MKKCTMCSLEKSTDSFYEQVQVGSNGQRWHYLDSFCKQCRSRYTSLRRQERKRQAVEYLGGQCVRCGLKTDRVEVYDFHHRDPSQKDFSIGKNVRSLQAIMPELDKCDLVCSNCHRIIHAESEPKAMRESLSSQCPRKPA